MMNTVILEKTIFDNLLSNRTDSNIFGIIIGQVNPSTGSNYIFLPLETPPVEKESDTDVCEMDWMAQHASNVYSMLPGGLYVRGIFVLVSHDSSLDSEATLKRILYQIHQVQTNSDDALFTKKCGISSNPSNQILLIINQKRREFYAKSLQCDSSRSRFIKIKVKLQAFTEHWVRLQTRINITMETNLPKERTKEKILKAFKTAVQPLLQQIVIDGKLLVNGELRENSELVLSDWKSLNFKHALGQCDEDLDDNSIPLTEPLPYLTLAGFEFPGFQYSSDEEEMNLKTTPTNHLLVQGRVPGLTYLHENSTIDEVTRAIKEDIVRSLHTRLQLLSDELTVMGGELHSSRILLPQRVLVNLPFCPGLPLSDYKFFSETVEDVVSRVRFFCRYHSGNRFSNSRDGDSGAFVSGYRSLGHSLTSSRAATPASTPDAESLIDENCIDDAFEITAEHCVEEENLEEESVVLEDMQIKSPGRILNFHCTLLIFTIVTLVVALLSFYVF